jgi:hypothetical protein
MTVSVENLIEAKDKINMVVSKIDFITTSQMGSEMDGLALILLDIQDDLREVVPILQ